MTDKNIFNKISLQCKRVKKVSCQMCKVFPAFWCGDLLESLQNFQIVVERINGHS